MSRHTIPVVLVATFLVVATGAAGAVAAPLASDGAGAAATLQEGDGNTTVTPSPNETDATDTNETNASDRPATFGAVVSSFMQTSAADAENEVEAGLFEARFDRSNASERARLVRQRATQLGDRIEELREERATLLEAGNVSVRERAEAARLAAQSSGLADSIDRTVSAAQAANVELNRTRLDGLRSEARNLTGPEVAELARGLVDRKDGPPRGPPEDRGPDRGGPDAATNETAEDDRPGRSGGAPGRDTTDGENVTDRGQSGPGASGPADGGDGTTDSDSGSSDDTDGSDTGSTDGEADGTPTATPSDEDDGDGSDARPGAGSGSSG